VFLYTCISNRVHKAQIWQKAVDWIANSETRVRVESQMIAGEQFTVWRWIHSDPPATEVKYQIVFNDKALVIQPLEFAEDYN